MQYIILITIGLLFTQCNRFKLKHSKQEVKCIFMDLNPNFNSDKWIADSLGCLGYRAKILNNEEYYLKLKKGLTKECILYFLGKPTNSHKNILEYNTSSSSCKEKSMHTETIVLFFKKDLFHRSIIDIE